MDKDEKVGEMTKDWGGSSSTNISAYGNPGTTEVKSQRAPKRKMGDTEIATLTKDDRVELAGKEIDAACAQFEAKMSGRGYRPIVDQSGFVYLLTLVRKDILKNRLEKHHIKVRYAPHFSSQHDNQYSMNYRPNEAKRPSSEKGVVPGRCLSCSPANGTKDRVFRVSGDPGANSTLPPCPVPMYFFPKPYPFSRNPVIESSLPRHLRPSNPKLRARIPDPWAFSLQLFETDPASTCGRSIGHSRRGLKSYACYSIDTRSGMIHIQSLAPAGSSFDLAWDMFCNFFSRRVGVDWKDIHGEWKKGIPCERLLSEKPHGEDGADDGGCFGISRTRQLQGRNGEVYTVFDSVEARSRKPSVTVLMNRHEHVAEDRLDVRAKTPERGW
ncbi:uncharacterized protein Z520_04716 [Fonsecaea multimorphosa CBS 102226]|uniref:Uncharacterized protein n=1 Tax=Fonsecaea multimorphosa CBS 102226 TaxID=1442371 RepID=A0A0D2HB61_9EURO|nr:uncharacterized protein Z520_04716 [Fonsecaea multimorphosa CBS 102226]KIX99140.1 hypothetical protein Z520_04716 [Fonsecaea multimorphosa CBS 102226]OAL26052.1 hypothetical protein AYO22_04466 [Fonsecaea multimorphosa]